MKRLAVLGVLLLVVPAAFSWAQRRAGHPPRIVQAPGPLVASPVSEPGGFALSSPAVGPDGVLPAEFTGDGAGHSPPLAWSGAPAATRSYALVMHHLDPHGRIKWYWLLYDLPADVHSLAAGEYGVGTCGANSINGRTAYAPPHSKGPGPKTYLVTLYALADSPRITTSPDQLTRARLLAAIQPLVLARAQLRLVYTR